jgi:type II secretory pathway pseudopilin PulG
MRDPSARRVDAAAGFSILEALIAGAILLFIALGLVPLFAQAIRDNETGSDTTQATNGNKSRLEESLQLPFNSTVLDVPAGAGEGQVVESFSQGDRNRVGDDNEGWWPGAPADKGMLLWTRTTRIHQYSMGDLDKRSKDFVLTPDEREPGGSDPAYVHLKEVEVVLESEKDSTLFGGGRRVTFRVLKPF